MEIGFLLKQKRNEHGGDNERCVYTHARARALRCGNAARDVSMLVAASSQASQPASLSAVAAGDACISVMLARNWFSSTYRNRQARLPTFALLHSFEPYHGLIGQLRNICQNAFTGILLL
jgi:hypothetical protein